MGTGAGNRMGDEVLPENQADVAAEIPVAQESVPSAVSLEEAKRRDEQESRSKAKAKQRAEEEARLRAEEESRLKSEALQAKNEERPSSSTAGPEWHETLDAQGELGSNPKARANQKDEEKKKKKKKKKQEGNIRSSF